MEWQGFKIWEYAGIAEQCPRFASPDRISGEPAINTVLAKIDPLLVRINKNFGGEIMPAEAVAV
jgi:hypothetical protein